MKYLFSLLFVFMFATQSQANTTPLEKEKQDSTQVVMQDVIINIQSLEVGKEIKTFNDILESVADKNQPELKQELLKTYNWTYIKPLGLYKRDNVLKHPNLRHKAHILKSKYFLSPVRNYKETYSLNYCN